MAAIGTAVVALLKAGDHIVTSQYLFGNTASLFQTFERHGIEVSFVDATEVAHVEKALRPNTKMVFTETIANPRTQIADLAGIGALCASDRCSTSSTIPSPHLFCFSRRVLVRT